MSILVNVLGWTGAVAVLLAYFLVTTGRVEARSYTFQLVNLYGAVGLMAVSLYYHVLPNVALNFVWAVIGVAGIWSILRKNRGVPPAASYCGLCKQTHTMNGIGCPSVPVDKW